MTDNGALIFHITSGAEWRAAQASGSYRGSTLGKTLDDVGFIHCSYARQAVGVANAIYRGERGLVLLAIDRGRLKAPLRDEPVPGTGQEFPHIYGPLNTDAVVDIIPFEPSPDGDFELPAALR